MVNLSFFWLNKEDLLLQFLQECQESKQLAGIWQIFRPMRIILCAWWRMVNPWCWGEGPRLLPVGHWHLPRELIFKWQVISYKIQKSYKLQVIKDQLIKFELAKTLIGHLWWFRTLFEDIDCEWVKIITSRLIDMDTNNQHELSLCIADEELLLFTLFIAYGRV